MNTTIGEVEDTTLDAIAKMRADNDPIKTIEDAHQLHETLLAMQGEVAAVRREAVRKLRMDGWKLKEIAAATGLTKQRIYQLEQGQDRKEKG